MKNLSLNFGHPVQGKARFSSSSPGLRNGLKKEPLIIDTNESNLLEIPLTHLEQGFWKVIFDWKYDGRNYSCQTELEITDLVM